MHSLPPQPAQTHLHVQSREGEINLGQGPNQLPPREQAHREGWKAATRTPVPKKPVEEEQLVHSTEGTMNGWEKI